MKFQPGEFMDTSVYGHFLPLSGGSPVQRRIRFNPVAFFQISAVLQQLKPLMDDLMDFLHKKIIFCEEYRKPLLCIFLLSFLLIFLFLHLLISLCFLFLFLFFTLVCIAFYLFLKFQWNNIKKWDHWWKERGKGCEGYMYRLCFKILLVY